MELGQLLLLLPNTSEFSIRAKALTLSKSELTTPVVIFLIGLTPVPLLTTKLYPVALLLLQF